MPPPRPRPTIIEVHGGAFVGGSRTDNDSDTEQWALYGYVGVTIDYRLVSVANAGGDNEVANATAATLDAQQAVRFLKANASTYGIDPNRIVMEGDSAGGALALGTAVGASFPYSGPLSSYSPSVAAAISTGAFLTPALADLTLTDTEAPVVMFQYAYDQATYVTASYAFETCDALRAAGNACYEVESAGTGHTADLIAGGPFWATEIAPFVWEELNLSTAAPLDKERIYSFNGLASILRCHPKGKREEYSPTTVLSSSNHPLVRARCRLVATLNVDVCSEWIPQTVGTGRDLVVFLDR